MENTNLLVDSTLQVFYCLFEFYHGIRHLELRKYSFEAL